MGTITRRGAFTCSMRYVVLLLVLVAAPAVAQPGDVRIPYERQAGQAYTVRIERTGEERAGGRLVQSIAVAATAAVRVEAASRDGVRATWTLGPVAVNATGGVVGEALGPATAFGLLRGLVVAFEAGPDGRPRRLLNPDSVRAAFLRVVRADEERPGAFASLAAVALREDLRARLADAAALADLVLDEPRLLTTLSGRALPRGGAVTEAAERESPLTAGPVRTTVTTRLDSLGGGGHLAYVTWQARADPDALVESVIAVLQAQAPGDVDPTLVEDLAASLALEESARFVVDLRGGWVRSVDYHKSVRAVGRERTERVRLTTTPPGS